jgi:hypothetical protein
MYSIYCPLQTYQSRLHNIMTTFPPCKYRLAENCTSWRTDLLSTVFIICASQATPERSWKRKQTLSWQFLNRGALTLRLFSPHQTSSSHSITKTSKSRHARRGSTTKTDAFYAPIMEGSSEPSASPKQC